MVCNLQHILDENELKYVPETNMNKLKEAEKAYKECWKIHRKAWWEEKWDAESGKFRNVEMRNEDHKPWPEKSKLKWYMEIKRAEIRDKIYEMEWLSYKKKDQLEKEELKEAWEKFYNENKKEIYDYLGREVPIPFNPSVMINISPNWKGKFGRDAITDKLMIKKFIIVVEKYLKASNRYSKWKWNLECGGEGNHLHAHIVAEIRPGSYKSVMTHLNKGNHSNEIRKIWDQTFPEGYQRVCKGKYSIQRILLRNEELLKDKLKYLIENEKPEGHKNLRDLDILKNEGF